MSGLSMFFAANADKRENKKVVVSNRFKDENGYPIPWEILNIDADTDEAIRKECTKRVPVVGKKNQFTQDFDSNAYLAKLAARSVVFPNLNDAELQNSYGVMSAEQLIKKMLYADEFNLLAESLTSTSTDINDEVEEAKN